jgi:hypothetical protein
MEKAIGEKFACTSHPETAEDEGRRRRGGLGVTLPTSFGKCG